MVAPRGACVVALGGGVHGIRRDTVNERAVRILLECILVIIAIRVLLARVILNKKLSTFKQECITVGCVPLAY